MDVEPKLSLQGSPFPIDSLIIFSIISKLMGKNPEDWDKHLRGISQRGYNMVHFTPLQKRGDSNSPYSIFDQHLFDPEYFPNGESDVAAMVMKMENEYGLMGLTDVVLNHTANNSPWLEEHPEAGYNIRTAPHLESAYELDTALLKFGEELEKHGLPTEFHSEQDLLRVMEGVKSEVLAKLQLWEYYVLDTERNTNDIVKAWTEGQVIFQDDGFGKPGMRGLDEVKDWPLKQKADWLIDYAMVGGDRMGERFRRRMEPQIAAGLLSALLGRRDSRTHDAPDDRVAHGTMLRLLEECNLQFYREYDTDTAEIMEQLFNRI
ncbi:hypothetical protein LTS18_001862, partial [Coniosporium uncinatum]